MSKLDCEYARRLIHLRLDGELGDDEALLLEEHLERCDDCRLLLEELHRVGAALREGLGAMPLPEPSVRAARQRVARARAGRTLWATWLPAAAAFVL